MSTGACFDIFITYSKQPSCFCWTFSTSFVFYVETVSENSSLICLNRQMKCFIYFVASSLVNKAYRRKTSAVNHKSDFVRSNFHRQIAKILLINNSSTLNVSESNLCVFTYLSHVYASDGKIKSRRKLKTYQFESQ